MVKQICLNPTGPIDNSDFLCRHGGVLPQKTEHVYDLCVAFPQPVWDLLHSQFGGGPACTRYNKFYQNVTVQLVQIQCIFFNSVVSNNLFSPDLVALMDL